jgi:hypothetical protein
MTETMISFGLFAVLIALNKKIRKVNYFLITFIISVIIILLLIFLIKLNYKPFIVPASYLLVFHPIRHIFIKLKKRELILYIRGVQLTPQEQLDISNEDYLFTFILIIIPILLFFVIII